MSQTPSNHPRASGAASEVAHRVLHPTRSAGTDMPPPPTDERALSWQDAMARAEQGAQPPPMSTGAAGSAAQELPGAPRTGPAESGEWSPMNPRGASAAPGTAGAGGAAGAAGTAGAAQSDRTPSDAAVDHDAQAMGGACDFADASAHMSPEELLQLKRDRFAIGLEPDAMPAQDLMGPDAVGFGEALAMRAEGRLAQPVSLVQPMGIGVRSLPESERPVVEGMTVGELALERRESDERADVLAQDEGSEIAATQAHLADVNTPDSLPLETIQSA